MTIDEMIKSGAVKEQKTGGGNAPGTGGGASLTAARPLNPEEQKCWDAYKSALQRGEPETKARQAVK